MSGQFRPIQIPPGVVAQPTKNVMSSNWAEVNMVRWIEGELQPIGGQSQYTYVFASRCRMIHGWYDLAGAYWIAYVCERNVYVDNGQGLVEITPSGGWPAPPLPSQGGYGELNYGQDLPVDNPATAYGTPRQSGTILGIDKIPNVWSVDNFGAILLVMSSVDGRLLQWNPNTPATLLTVVAPSNSSTVPHGRCFVITQERFVIMFGTYQDGTVTGGGSNRFAWCDQEDYTDWNYTDVVTQSGFLDVQPSSPIVCATAGRFGTLMFTGKKAYVVQYIGLPYIYDYVELGDGMTPWSPCSIVETGNSTLWQSQQGTFTFDGTTIIPVPCQVRKWITDDVDLQNVREFAFAFHNTQFSEWWWFFPQNGRLTPTRCVIYNYKEGWWSQGNLSRTAGVTSSYTVQPILADGTTAYQHELGPTYQGSQLPWAETFDLNLTGGPRLATLKQIIPDLNGPGLGNIQYSFFASMSRSQGSLAQMGAWSPPRFLRNDGYVDARVTGRDIRLQFQVMGPAVNPFTMGEHLMDFAVRGDR